MKLNKKNNAKKIFKEKGTCSRTFQYILNKEFGNELSQEECASDPLAGGIMRQGHQCGMLWGSALAIGAESYKRTKDINKASNLTLQATKKMMDSFVNITRSVNCLDITGCRMDNFFGMTKYMIKVMLKGMENSYCFNLAEDWYEDAIETSKEGLSNYQNTASLNTINCASEVVGKMGGRDKEKAMVAGFAGGMGLSGNGCGALSAAIWKKSLEWVKEHPGKSSFNNKESKRLLKPFLKETNGEMNCSQICGRTFETLQDHSEFLKNGGCSKLIETLAN